jgi:hypothetical protein
VSRANTPTLRPGDARSAASVNDIYTAVETAANAANEVNLAEEGVTRYVTQGFQKCETVVDIELNARVAKAAAGWATLVNGATTFRTGALNLGDNECYRIRGSIEYPSSVAAGVGVPAGVQVGLRIGWSIGGAVTTKAPRRKSVAAGAVRGLHGALMTEGLFFGALAFDWIELQDIAVGGTVRMDKCRLTVELYRRVNP